MTALLVYAGIMTLPAAAWALYCRWSERRWLAKARRQERSLARARLTNAIAAEVLAQVAPRPRVIIDPWSGFVEVRASCPEECAAIIAQSDAFKPKGAAR